MAYALLFSVFVISTCGLVYELISGALASYLLGDSVLQFSTVIGVYLFSMGIGSFFSRYISKDLPAVFIRVEILIAVVGGCSAALLFMVFEYVSSFRVILYSLVSLTGTLVGLEIPLLMRILKAHFEFKDLVSKVFTFDYVGALIASILFPLALAPHLGLVRSAFMFGMINACVAMWALALFRDEIRMSRVLAAEGAGALALLLAGFVYSGSIMGMAEASTYPDSVIYAKSSRYQRIVLTRSPYDIRLFLNGNLQFSSADEYRYHEALVHPAMGSMDGPKDILILGGGDGLAAREILKYPSVRSITLVDLDPEVTKLFAGNEILVKLNENSLASPKLKIVNADAFVWLREDKGTYDFIAVDFPDPSNFSIGKLYSASFDKLLFKALKDTGAAVIQSTSPYVARKSFWCVNNTLAAAGFHTTPYHAYVPAFGDWGYVLASKRPFTPPLKYPAGLKYVSVETVKGMLEFPRDMEAVETEVNRLNNQVLVRYFEDEWAKYSRVNQ
ncbi:MAG: polyamine aminopropyltransferase [Nitrospinae bacterium]|nr:polyamine aminopropyltransferase [Nitrospinota bacterium]